ncbi:single-stranded-DNA-specific exonuclease RecJ [Treponema socranskii]|uniref:single-stranded-DNA-specific exonuclease RecJ n=1 Tax=Treponema socranskii TaxID=53419 RepID=UPI0023F53001|nr:single-stranded-DNA-specific exonuclease RecJ [Treponema socranskii]
MEKILKEWRKKEVSREAVKALCDLYGVDALTASIMVRRGITQANDVLYFKESDLRFLHNPFLFSNMEDAVDRITSAKEEGEKILIFGDRDVDGVSATAILYTYLQKSGYDVSWRLPVGDDAYGLSMQAVNDFAKDYGSLIITVDCGISNAAEVAHARELGIDVIVTDHHNPPETLPDASAILDPKVKDSGYPFADISGAAVSYKLVEALRFSESELYKAEIALLNVRPAETEGVYIDCVKVRNLVRTASLSEHIRGGGISIAQTKLPEFLKGAQIFTWNEEAVKKQLSDIFGRGVEFNTADLRPEVSKLIPSLSRMSLLAAKDASRIAKYSAHPISEIDGFYNIFVSFAEKKIETKQILADRQNDLELVAVAAIADIMPLKDENRILVKAGLDAINEGKVRPGLVELFSRLSVAGKKISSSDLSWTVIPALNAAGRMGESNAALEMLISPDADVREKRAEEIIALNEKRKAFVGDAASVTAIQAEESFERCGKKLCVVVDERINKGVTGILASRLMAKYKTPAIVITFIDGDVAVGSMRSCRGLNATDFLASLGDIFISYGGHNCAAGFSFPKEKLPLFTERLKTAALHIVLDPESDTLDVDAELPANYLSPAILSVVDAFEPFGEGNREIVFLSKALPVTDATLVGKSERRHLKITFDCGKYKFPALFWGEGERLGRDFNKGDVLDVLYSMNRNTFNGAVTPQMIITDFVRSGGHGHV